MKTVWHPLLDGERAADARGAVTAVAAALRDPPPATMPGDRDHSEVDEVSLGRGRAGYAVLYDYLARAGLDPGGSETTDSFLSDAVDSVAGLDLSTSLYMGFTGVAWAIEVTKRGGDPDTDPNEQIDDVLSEFVARGPWRGDYDLISGLVGIGVYAVERLPRPAATVCLEHVVGRLSELADHRRDGITWLTRPELLPPKARREYARGYYNLGVAHGMPGVLALLGACCASDVAAGDAALLIEGAVSWMLSKQLPPESPSRFPPLVSVGVDSEPARAAWCYGDPGLACALLVAARGVGREDWEREAVDIALAAARRPPETARVQDAGLCHGSAGLAHLFNRLYQATGVDELKRAALHWVDHTLESRHAEGGVEGFETWDAEHGENVAHPGFLQGAAGVALALASATSDVEPEWDRVLLASARPNLP